MLTRIRLLSCLYRYPSGNTQGEYFTSNILCLHGERMDSARFYNVCDTFFGSVEYDKSVLANANKNFANSKDTILTLFYKIQNKMFKKN